MISLAFQQFSLFRLFAGKERVVDQAHYHRNMNLRVLDVLMPICYTTIWVTHAHAEAQAQTNILHANASFGMSWRSRKSIEQQKGNSFILFHFISFFFFCFAGRGVRIGLTGSFVECHNKSSTKIQIVTQSHTLRRTEFCKHYGIPDNETKAAAKTKPHDTI